MTAEQAADLECLRVGLALDSDTPQNGQETEGNLARTYLARLKQSDPERDWKAAATPFPPTMRYGDFAVKMVACIPRPSGLRKNR